MFQSTSKPTPTGVLLVVAAPAEAEAIRRAFDVPLPESQYANQPKIKTDNPTSQHPFWTRESLGDHLDMVVSGVGKSQAAGATAWAFDAARHAGVLSIGVGGVLPGAPQGLDLGTSVLASRSLFADEGGVTPDGFQSIDSMGFPAAGFGETGTPGDPDWASTLNRVTDCTGWIATVSTCSGTDRHARAVVDRTGAVVENMEGAAVAAVLSRLPQTPSPKFNEIRVISNTTGNRSAQRWDLPLALSRLGAVTQNACRALLLGTADDADEPKNQ